MRISDWSSDVCSSDLELVALVVERAHIRTDLLRAVGGEHTAAATVPGLLRPGRRDLLAGSGEAAIEQIDRKSVVWGKSESVRVELGGRRDIKKKRRTSQV